MITLLILAAIALRGYLPGIETPVPVDDEPRRASPVAFAAVLLLLCAAIAIIGIAIVARLRMPRAIRPEGGELGRGAGGGVGRPSWRFALIGLAVLIGWLLLLLALTWFTEPGMPDAPPPPEAAEDGTAPAPTVAEEPDDDPGESGLGNLLIPPMLLLMALVVAGTAIASRRRALPSRSAEIPFTGTAAEPASATSLARAAELGLAEIGDVSREPREAIIACYAAMERELTQVPGAVPQACDTPTEVLNRAVDSGALHADSAVELVQLFEEARFSPHVMTEQHRDAAIRVLSRVLAELPQRTGTS
ncbi:DUF4129 domain-containing protein [Mycolicibacterium phlei]